MDQHAPNTDAAPVPTAARVLGRALPAAASMAIGLPLATWWLVDATGDGGPWWGWLLIFVAILGLSAIIQRYASPPRPRIDQRIGQVKRASATAAAAKTGELLACPKVRTAVGVATCADIEVLTGYAFLLVAITLSALVLPDLWTALLPVTVLTGLETLRVRRSWGYLRPAHRRAHRLMTRFSVLGPRHAKALRTPSRAPADCFGVDRRLRCRCPPPRLGRSCRTDRHVLDAEAPPVYRPPQGKHSCSQMMQ